MNTHLCPGCWAAQVPRNRLSCPRCWFLLPPDLRAKIWREFRAGAGSPAHLRAIGEAVAWYDQRQASQNQDLTSQ